LDGHHPIWMIQAAPEADVSMGVFRRAGYTTFLASAHFPKTAPTLSRRPSLAEKRPARKHPERLF
jgi:hypothetical protein